jgi:hypothetical protein
MFTRRGSCTLDFRMIHSAPRVSWIKCRFVPHFVVRATGNQPPRDACHAPQPPAGRVRLSARGTSPIVSTPADAVALTRIMHTDGAPAGHKVPPRITHHHEPPLRSLGSVPVPASHQASGAHPPPSGLTGPLLRDLRRFVRGPSAPRSSGRFVPPVIAAFYRVMPPCIGSRGPNGWRRRTRRRRFRSCCAAARARPALAWMRREPVPGR